MSPDTIDWVSLGRLPQLVLTDDDVDQIALMQFGLLPPQLRFQPGVDLPGDQIVLQDRTSTPLALATDAGDHWQVEMLRPVPHLEPWPQHWDGAVVIVEGRIEPDTALPKEPTLWVVPGPADATGRRLLAQARASARPTDAVRRLPQPRGVGLLIGVEIPTAEVVAVRLTGRESGHVGAPGAAVSDAGGTVIFFTGLSGSGKSTVANALAAELAGRTERPLTLLDGDEVRQMLSSELGFDDAGRALNIRRISWVAALAARHGGIAIAAPIAPFAAGRAEARRMAEEVGDFLLVWLDTDLSTCEQRDAKGLYARARAGEVANFTGISSPYEPATDADLVIDTARTTVEHAVEQIIAELTRRGRLEQW